MKRKIICIAILILSFGLSGCSQNVKTAQSKAVKSADPEFAKVGNEKNGNRQMFVYNQTGETITSVKIRQSGKKKWSQNILQKKESIAKDTKVQLFLPIKNVKETYDVYLSFGKKKHRTLSKVEIEDTKSIRIYKTKHIAYLEYVSRKKQDIVSTKAAEQKIFKIREEKRKEAERKAQEARERAAKEAEAARQAAQEATRQNSGSGNSNRSNRSQGRQEENCENSGENGHYVDDGNGGWKWVPN